MPLRMRLICSRHWRISCSSTSVRATASTAFGPHTSKACERSCPSDINRSNLQFVFIDCVGFGRRTPPPSGRVNGRPAAVTAARPVTNMHDGAYDDTILREQFDIGLLFGSTLLFQCRIVNEWAVFLCIFVNRRGRLVCRNPIDEASQLFPRLFLPCIHCANLVVNRAQEGLKDLV